MIKGRQSRDNPREIERLNIDNNRKKVNACVARVNTLRIHKRRAEIPISVTSIDDNKGGNPPATKSQEDNSKGLTKYIIMITRATVQRVSFFFFYNIISFPVALELPPLL